MSVCIARLVEARFVQAAGLRALPAPVQPVVRVRVYHPAPGRSVVYEAEPEVVVLPDGTRVERYDAEGTTVYVRPAREWRPDPGTTPRTRPAGAPERPGMLRPVSPPVMRERPVEPVRRGLWDRFRERWEATRAARRRREEVRRQGTRGVPFGALLTANAWLMAHADSGAPWARVGGPA